MASPSAEDTALVEKAYAFAAEAHKDHKRLSGEPYLNHLVETAKSLAELGMGAKTIAAGLLHDSIEDVGVKPETIEAEFGKEVLFLIEGVTKLGHLKYHGTERHRESLRKLLVATGKDVRVLIIKLMDRLHNMRTLEHVPEEKRKRIALETLEIYAAIAHRLAWALCAKSSRTWHLNTLTLSSLPKRKNF
jgi:guanosine-3',5'-bis(diphosphate) 3'-pyrophosphohydrolase